VFDGSIKCVQSTTFFRVDTYSRETYEIIAFPLWDSCKANCKKRRSLEIINCQRKMCFRQAGCCYVVAFIYSIQKAASAEEQLFRQKSRRKTCTDFLGEKLPWGVLSID
jgi:hypothetical protein